MSFTILILISLTGAVILGFIFAWFWLQKQVQSLELEKAAMEKELAALEATIGQLESFIESMQLKLDNLQKENQEIEGEMIKLQSTTRVMEGEMKLVEREKEQLQTELDLLNEDLQNNIREIEVIREIPVYDTDDTPGETKEISELDKRIENAKRLVNAFKKGVSEKDHPHAD